MSEQGKTDIVYRIRSWKAECVSNGLTYKEVIERAEMDYNSVINAMGSAMKGNENVISHDRILQLEKVVSIMILERLFTKK